MLLKSYESVPFGVVLALSEQARGVEKRGWRKAVTAAAVFADVCEPVPLPRWHILTLCPEPLLAWEVSTQLWPHGYQQ